MFFKGISKWEKTKKDSCLVGYTVFFLTGEEKKDDVVSVVCVWGTWTLQAPVWIPRSACIHRPRTNAPGSRKMLEGLDKNMFFIRKNSPTQTPRKNSPPTSPRYTTAKPPAPAPLGKLARAPVGRSRSSSHGPPPEALGSD